MRISSGWEYTLVCVAIIVISINGKPKISRKDDRECKYLFKLFIYFINPLGTANGSGMGDHVGNFKAHRTIASFAQYAFVPNDIRHFPEFLSAHVALFSVEFPD